MAIPEITIDKETYSETETKQLFSKYGLEWETRSERYKNLKDTIFEQINNGRWYIARVDGKPLASQGIGEFEGVYLLLGAKSFAERGTKVGTRLTTHVINKHGDKPIMGSAGSPAGKKLLVNKNNFKIINIKNGEVQGNEDLPIEVKSALEIASDKGLGRTGIPVRKMYLKLPDRWFVMLKSV